MQTTTTKPFFIIRFFRWLLSWRTIRRFLLSVAVLATLWALFCAEENWRGKRAWKKYKAAQETKGEQLDLTSYIPKPVPDEQNFGATPFFKNLFPKPPQDKPDWSSNYNAAAAMITSTNRAKGERHFNDLAAWKMAYAAAHAGKKQKDGVGFQTENLDAASRLQAAPVVLAELQECEPVFAELSSASVRPDSRYFVYYDMENPAAILLPHLGQVKGVIRRLELRACAELAVGNSDAALSDVKLMIRLLDSIREEPFLISWLVRVAGFHITIQPVWEGLADQRWTEAELQALQSWLQSLDFVAELDQALNGERAFMLQGTDVFIQGKHSLVGLIRGDWYQTKTYSLGERLLTSAQRNFSPIPGWFSLEKVNICRMHEEDLKGKFSVKEKRVFRERIKAEDLELGMLLDFPSVSLKSFLQHRAFAAMALPALEKTPVKAANAQITADQALLACALERHRLAHNVFPENLSALVPGFLPKLPHDPLTGESYRYRRTEDGQFILYSIGWNEKDDGGKPGKTLWDNKDGDWVWGYPAKQ